MRQFAILLVSLPIAFAAPAAAQSDMNDLLDLSLEELLEVEVSTASIDALPWTRQPATLTVLTRRDLQAMGARNLMDALEHVPGTAFGVDVFGAVSLVFRGLWGNEGKVLLLVDDMPVNDVLYGNVSLYGRYPIEQIDRVEVIRGAGSAKYGGAAQLAVIRVYTRSVDGVAVNADLQSIAGTGGRGAATVSAGMTRGDVEVAMTGHWADGAYSGADWLDTNGDVTSLDALTHLAYRNLGAKLDYRGFMARLFVDDLRSRNPHNFGFAREGEEVRFSSLDLLLAWDLRVGDHLTLRPRFVGHRQKDWFIDRDPEVLPLPLDFFLPAGSDLYSLEARFSAGHVDVLAGLEYAREFARADSPGGQADRPEVYFAGRPEVDYDTRAAFAQAEWVDGPWTVSAGLRHSDHSFAGASTVPRLSVVYAADDWHLKGHFGRAFREPDIEVINASDQAAGNIRPEQTTQYEISGGWLPIPEVFWSAALFWTRVEDPIVYTSSARAEDENYFYRNVGAGGSTGLETEVRAHVGDAVLSGAWSFYRAMGVPIEAIAVPGDDDRHLGAPRHKLTASADLGLGRGGVRVRPSVVWYSEASAYVYTPGAEGLYGNPLAVGRLGSRTYADLTLSHRSGSVEWSAGVHDLFDQVRVFPQPYRGESTPWPGAGRTFRFGVGISW